MQRYFVYMVRCKDDSLYTGWTNDVEKRVASHNTGLGAKYTRAKRPVELVYVQEFFSKREAMRREYEIKTYSKEKKKQLLTG